MVFVSWIVSHLDPLAALAVGARIAEDADLVFLAARRPRARGYRVAVLPGRRPVVLGPAMAGAQGHGAVGQIDEEGEAALDQHEGGEQGEREEGGTPADPPRTRRGRMASREEPGVLSQEGQQQQIEPEVIELQHDTPSLPRLAGIFSPAARKVKAAGRQA